MVIIDGREIKNIKIKPKWMELFPLTNSNTIQAIYPNIYIPYKHFSKFTKLDSDPFLKSKIVHELEHIKREKEQGFFKFLIKYAFLPKYRLNEELEADFAAMRFLKKNGLIFDVEKRSTILSGWNYLWPEKREIVLEMLNNLWKKA